MTDAMFSQLVENIRRDGCLTSVPLVYDDDGKLEVLSGNHRVMAAIKAGLEEAEVMEITTPLGREQRVAIQLSHNAIAGADDPSILAELWADLDFAYKEYSGLTEEDLAGITEIDTTAISVEAPKYEELNLAAIIHDARWICPRRALLAGLTSGFRVGFSGRGCGLMVGVHRSAYAASLMGLERRCSRPSRRGLADMDRMTAGRS